MKQKQVLRAAFSLVLFFGLALFVPVVRAVPNGASCTGQGLNTGNCSTLATCGGSSLGTGNCDPGLICCGVLNPAPAPAPAPGPAPAPAPAPASGSVTCPAGFTSQSGVCFPDNTGLSNLPIATLLRNLMNWLLMILGFIGIIAFAISGIQYLTAAGDEHQIDTAKRNMQYSIIGVIVALSGLVVIFAVTNALAGGRFF